MCLSGPKCLRLSSRNFSTRGMRFRRRPRDAAKGTPRSGSPSVCLRVCVCVCPYVTGVSLSLCFICIMNFTRRRGGFILLFKKKKIDSRHNVRLANVVLLARTDVSGGGGAGRGAAARAARARSLPPPADRLVIKW